MIPTYDEADNIQVVIDRVRQRLPESTYSSSTTTVLTAPPPSSRPTPTTGITSSCSGTAEKSGLGAAYRAGFRWALDRHYDVIVQMDADLSHPPEPGPALIAALEDADVAIGSRYVAGGGIARTGRGADG